MPEIPLDHPMDLHWSADHRTLYHYIIYRIEECGVDDGAMNFDKPEKRVAPYSREDYKAAWLRGFDTGRDLVFEALNAVSLINSQTD